MATNAAIQSGLSAEAYLEGELTASVKHELIDGVAYAMAGVSKNHQRISDNVLVGLHLHLRNQRCEPFGSDVKVKVGDDFFYPDAMVVCDDVSENSYYTESPTILVEVLSPSTRRLDQTLKRSRYQTIPSLQELVLIEQDVVDVEVCRRSSGWRSQHYFLGDDITFESIGVTLSVEDIYQRVQNADVLAFLQQ
jgi:Uma2 family endonuclease